MKFSHSYPVLSMIALSVCLSITGCSKSTNTQITAPTDNTIVSSDDNSGSIDDSNTGNVKFEGTLDNDRKGIELLKACNSSHVDLSRLEKIIATGVDLNKIYEVGNYQYTALGVLCRQDNIDRDAIKLLIRSGANINQPINEQGVTPLMIVCDHKDIDKSDIKFLIDSGADVNSKDCWPALLPHLLYQSVVIIFKGGRA